MVGFQPFLTRITPGCSLLTSKHTVLSQVSQTENGHHNRRWRHHRATHRGSVDHADICRSCVSSVTLRTKERP
jgi:hypothetical protein